MNFAGKTALITGGAGIIGMAAARQPIAEGAKVALVDRDAEQLRIAAAGLEPGKVITITADVTKGPECAKYAHEAHAALGPIDVFFNNAGIEDKFAPLTDFPEDVFEEVYAVNVIPLSHCR